MCGKSHDTMTEHGKKMSDKQCTVACVEHGSQYVFVNGQLEFVDGRVTGAKAGRPLRNSTWKGPAALEASAR